jgi:hypothetical protein
MDRRSKDKATKGDAASDFDALSRVARGWVLNKKVRRFHAGLSIGLDSPPRPLVH